MGCDPDRGAPQARDQDGRHHRGQFRRTGPASDQRARQAAGRCHGRGFGHGRVLPLSRFARPADAGDRGKRRSPSRGAPPTARRRRCHHPWNYPLLILSFKLPSALLAGNTLVVKPAPTTPLSTLKFAELVKDVLPKGVLNVIADANDLGDAMTKHPDIRKISFTGSSATGQKVMASAAQTLKRITLELGGNDAGIVLDDVDPKKVAPGIFEGAFQNSGQVCLAIKRLYVHESVYDELCNELVAIAKNTVVDDGSKQGTKLGPLQNKMQYEKVKAFLKDARKNGNVIAGGAAMDRPGYFIEPTIVRDIKEGSRLVDEEQFGPVLPVIKYSDSDDVVSRANATTYGLGASVWSSDIARAHKVASQIEAGTVWINKHLDMAPHIPFGGAKQSGIGTEFAEEGLAEFTQLQIINGPGAGA